MPSAAQCCVGRDGFEQAGHNGAAVEYGSQQLYVGTSSRLEDTVTLHPAINISRIKSPVCRVWIVLRAQQQQKEEKKHLEDDLGEDQVRSRAYRAWLCTAMCSTAVCTAAVL
jgi:hypothetical protein